MSLFECAYEGITGLPGLRELHIHDTIIVMGGLKVLALENIEKPLASVLSGKTLDSIRTLGLHFAVRDPSLLCAILASFPRLETLTVPMLHFEHFSTFQSSFLSTVIHACPKTLTGLSMRAEFITFSTGLGERGTLADIAMFLTRTELGPRETLPNLMNLQLVSLRVTNQGQRIGSDIKKILTAVPNLRTLTMRYTVDAVVYAADNGKERNDPESSRFWGKIPWVCTLIENVNEFCRMVAERREEQREICVYYLNEYGGKLEYVVNAGEGKGGKFVDGEGHVAKVRKA